MRVLFLTALIVCGGAASGSASANGTPPREYSCQFGQGSTVAYASGKYVTKPVKTLAFKISGVDLEGQQALLQAGAGKVKLRVVRAVNANHFLEVVTEGFLNLTTVYDFDAKSRSYPAVHSRHFGLFGEPVVAQYYGFCKAVK